MMSKRFIAILAAWIFLLSSLPVFALPGDKVATMSKGDRAPFTGLLMNRQLADRIEAEKKTQIDKKIAAIECKATVALSENDAKRDMEIQLARYSAFSEMHTQIIKVKNGQIEFLRKNYLPREWYESPVFLVSAGIVIGTGLVIGSAHIVKTVR
jgi:hypothetical protein